ncbi:MAG: peroxidase family protein [Crocosphaera sp.]
MNPEVNYLEIDDSYENNDRLRRAFNLRRNEGVYLSDIDGEGVALDEDFYRIQVTDQALRVVVELEFDHAMGDLDLFLFDRRGNLIAESTSTDDNELIDITVEKKGKYFVKVSPVDDSGNTYDLVWDDFIPENAFRTIDGFGNNLENPQFGTPFQNLSRLTSPDYEDGISEPRGGLEDSTLPNARAISNAIVAQGDQSVLSQSQLSDWIWMWGAFIDHDFVFTIPATPPGTNPNEPFNIEVPTGDPFFDPNGTGEEVIVMERNIPDPTTGTDPSNPRQITNTIGSFIDASLVYGSNQTDADLLRRQDGSGKLVTALSDDGEVILPFDEQGFFLAGDSRVNENPGFMAVHGLFVREHNRIVDEISEALDQGRRRITRFFEETGLSRGEFLYQSARRIVGAQIQQITYNEFLTALIGEDALPEYDGYDSTVNPDISVELQAAAFRIGHTMLSSQFLMVDSEGNAEALPLRDSFLETGIVLENGIDEFLSGLAAQQAQEIDELVVDDVRNFLFGNPGEGGFDLTAINIQRGREEGVGSLNFVRAELGLDPYESFDELTGGNTELADKFASVYDSIEDVDLWVGGYGEADVPGSEVGETFQAILVDGFLRMRDGDRFWYENDELLDNYRGIVDLNVTLADVIENNSDIDIDGSAFFVREPIVI